jgi:hypothetical protein
MANGSGVKLEFVMDVRPKRNHKYLICAGNDRIIYAAAKPGQEQYREILDGLPVKQVLGGGSALVYRPGLMELVLDHSSEYGGVPKQVLEHFSSEILTAYKRFWPELARVQCSSECAEMEKWKPLAERFGIVLEGQK